MLPAEYDRALEEAQQGLLLEPTNSICSWFLGLANVLTGRLKDGIICFENAVTYSGNIPYFKGWLGHALALHGSTEKAVQILEELKQDGQGKRFLYQISIIHLALGHHEQALNYLEQAFLRRSPYLIYLKVDPYLDSLRSNFQFIDMIKRMDEYPAGVN